MQRITSFQNIETWKQMEVVRRFKDRKKANQVWHAVMKLMNNDEVDKLKLNNDEADKKKTFEEKEKN